MSAASNEPVAKQFDGGLAQRTMLRWLLATRPKFLTASVLPVLVGTAWGARAAGALDGWAFALAMLATICLHASANVFNDVGDELGGSDRINDSRIYPYTGGSRFIQNGVMGLRAMLVLSSTLLAVALVLGLILAALKGTTVIWLGLAGIALGFCYSLPVVQLSGRGVGEVAVAIAFGALPVTGAAWIQAGTFGTVPAWLAVPVSLWVAAILIINEVPDRAADAAVGKRTLPVRIGEHGTRWLYAALHAIAVASVAAAVLLSALPVLVLVGPLVLTGLGFAAARGIGAEQARLKRSIELTLMIHALGCFWLLVCAMFIAP